MAGRSVVNKCEIHFNSNLHSIQFNSSFNSIQFIQFNSIHSFQFNSSFKSIQFNSIHTFTSLLMVVQSSRAYCCMAQLFSLFWSNKSADQSAISSSLLLLCVFPYVFTRALLALLNCAMPGLLHCCCVHIRSSPRAQDSAPARYAGDQPAP